MMPPERLLTDDELALIESDKKTAAPADAGAPESVPSEQDPLAEGVTADRASKWAVYDRVAHAYVAGTVRTRPPTEKMRAELEGDRFEWHRV